MLQRFAAGHNLARPPVCTLKSEPVVVADQQDEAERVGQVDVAQLGRSGESEVRVPGLEGTLELWCAGFDCLAAGGDRDSLVCHDHAACGIENADVAHIPVAVVAEVATRGVEDVGLDRRSVGRVAKVAGDANPPGPVPIAEACPDDQLSDGVAARFRGVSLHHSGGVGAGVVDVRRHHYEGAAERIPGDTTGPGGRRQCGGVGGDGGRPQDEQREDESSGERCWRPPTAEDSSGRREPHT